jgi:hypothetical protein
MLLSCFAWVRNHLTSSGRQHLSFLHILAVAFLCLIAPVPLYAETISGTVLDPSGAVVSGARIEITGEGLEQGLCFCQTHRANSIRLN